jgi:hypothetical protein
MPKKKSTRKKVETVKKVKRNILFDDVKYNSDDTINQLANIDFEHVTGSRGMETISLINSYKNKLRTSAPGSRVFLDWDKTLSKQDSIDYLSFLGESTKFEKSLEFYFGSPQRRENLRKFFAYIEKNGLTYYILTRNPTASDKNERYFFKIMMDTLLGNKKFNTDKQLLYCNGKYTSKSSYINKNFQLI